MRTCHRNVRGNRRSLVISQAYSSSEHRGYYPALYKEDLPLPFKLKALAYQEDITRSPHDRLANQILDSPVHFRTIDVNYAQIEALAQSGER